MSELVYSMLSVYNIKKTIIILGVNKLMLNWFGSIGLSIR